MNAKSQKLINFYHKNFSGIFILISGKLIVITDEPLVFLSTIFIFCSI